MTTKVTYAAVKRDVEAYNTSAKRFNKARRAKASAAKEDTAKGRRALHDLQILHNKALKAKAKAETSKKNYGAGH